MSSFIVKSPASKKLLNIAQISSNLPINILIIGDIGVGKKTLAKTILQDANIFEAKILEDSLIKQTINLEEYKELIITNIEQVINKKEFLERLNDIKIIATTSYLPQDIESLFAVKLDIPPLDKREEDLEELINIYSKEVEDIYQIIIDKKNLTLDLSSNAISLKKSIYKYSLLNSLKDEDIEYSLEQFFLNKLKKESSYKELLEYFEVPLLKAAKKRFKSQLQMANKLQLNRITLRKKIEQYSCQLDS